MKSIYIIGSLRNPEVPALANRIRLIGYDAFDSWFSAGPRADDHWREHSKQKSQSYGDALADHAAQHVFKFDKKYLDKSDMAVLVMPAGKSGHLELGYVVGSGKPGFILFDKEPEDRWDVMYNFATEVFFSHEQFLHYLQQ